MMIKPKLKAITLNLQVAIQLQTGPRDAICERPVNLASISPAVHPI